MWKFSNFLFVAILLQTTSGQQLFEGTICTSSKGFPGVCKKISVCPSVEDDIRNGRRPFPKTCVYDNNDPVVCCPNEDDGSAKKVCEGASGNKTTRNTEALRFKRGFNFNNVHGGSTVKPSEFPHMAAVGFIKRGITYWRCGGILISSKFVLTAAHCLNDTSRYRYGLARFVRLGDLDLKSSEDDAAKAQQFNVMKRVSHPEYKSPMKYHDIGLLQLDKDARFNEFVKPACLHVQPGNPNAKPTVIGWGSTEPGKNLTGQQLLKVDIDFQTMDKCDQVVSRLDASVVSRVLDVGLQEDSMVCAGVLEGGKDSCGGDSGGPLQVRGNSPNCQFDIVGLVSFGLADCAMPESPALYVRVSKYVPWIESVVCS